MMNGQSHEWSIGFCIEVKADRWLTFTIHDSHFQLEWSYLNGKNTAAFNRTPAILGHDLPLPTLPRTLSLLTDTFQDLLKMNGRIMLNSKSELALNLR